MQRISERRVWRAGARVAGGGLIHLVATLLVLRLIHASLVSEVWLIASNVVDGVRGKRREVAMDYDWLWVILAVGVLAPVGFVPVALARDACAWWRDYRRGRRDGAAWNVSYERSSAPGGDRPHRRDHGG